MESKIIISDLKIICIIGERDYERTKKQLVFLDIELFFDFAKAIKSDNLKDAVDYDALVNEVKAAVEKSKFQLIETLASYAADLIIKKYPVEKVLVRVKKPAAIKSAKYVAVEILRLKK